MLMKALKIKMKNGKFLLFFLMGNLSGQVSKNQSLMLNIITKVDGYEIVWPANVSRTGKYSVFYRNSEQPTSFFQPVGPDIMGPAQKASFKTNLRKVEFYVNYTNPNNQTEALGYISACNDYSPQFEKGRVILLIDSVLNTKLPTHIDTLKNDMLANGWFSTTVIASPNWNPELIKDSLEKIIKKGNFRQQVLYILGHVAVPYSGYFSVSGTRPPPDGHIEGSGNHTGAWPADAYYGDFEGIWEDGLVQCTTGSESRLHNIPGDGKFDPSVIPGTVSLDIGRVDFSNLPVFGVSEWELTRDYLSRVHRWKMGRINYVRRGLVDDNFPSLNLASTGYHNLSCFISLDSIFNDRDYFQAQKQENYWWSYGCGAGSYTSCSGIGTSTDFANLRTKDSFHNIFTILAGSYFGDWDSRNNLLRSALAAGSLATFWGGIPKWYVHHMANGKHIGYGARITQNNNNDYFNGSFNSSHKGVHIALLGDPTLELMPVKPPTHCVAESNNGKVTIKWNASEDADQYEVYILDLDSQKIIPVSSVGTCAKEIKDTFFVDECNWKTGNYVYGVLATQTSQNASGTFQNRSLLSLTEVQHINQRNSTNKSSKVTYYPNPSKQKIFVNNYLSSPSSWVLYDLNGRIIRSETEVNIQEGIDVSIISTGVYILKVSDLKGFNHEDLIYVGK
jgi:hypothetical protein